ncbi:hypothetical protein V6R21_31835 [Limibacter armeniacum]|uniref:hypothetical protein n=1 Tax=Limibacter armeniacum TaxID=466084 RepID=UPI002FE56EBE
MTYTTTTNKIKSNAPKASKSYAKLFEAALKNFDLFVEEEKERNYLEVKRKFAGHF